MSVNLSPFAGAGAQFFTDTGSPLTGGLLYSYAAGTTTPATTYTSSDGLTANSNPIVLDSAGRVPYEIWLTSGDSYKFVLKTSVGTTVGTWDNIDGINDVTVGTSFYADAFTTTAGQTTFTLSANPGSINNLNVSLDGAVLTAGADFTWTGTTLVLTMAAFAGQTLRVAYSSAAGVKAISPGSVVDASVAIGTKLYNRINDIVDVKDYGAVGDGVTDDTAAIQAAINYWAANPVDLVFPTGSNFYVTASIVATFSSNSVLQKRISGYGSRLTTSAGVVNALTVTVSGASTAVRNLIIEGLEIAHAGTGYGLVMQGPLSSTSYLYGCTVRDLVITGASGMSLLGNFFESEVDNCRIEAGTTGYGIYISTAGGSGSGSGGIISSLALLQNTVRGGVNCVYGNNDISDVSIWGGTYLSSQNEGIYLANAQGGLLYGAHIEDVWQSASGFVAGNSAMRIIVAASFSIKDCTFAVGTGKANECIRVYVSGNGTAHLTPGYVFGIGTNYYLQGAANSYAILHGEATYTNLGGVAITHIKGLRTLSPVSSKNTYTITSPTTVTPSSDYGVYFLSLTSNPTIAAPTFTPAYGDELEFFFEQAGAGGNTVTWNSVYSVGSFVPTSAYGKVSSIRMKYVNTFVNGAKWVVASTGTT